MDFSIQLDMTSREDGHRNWSGTSRVYRRMTTIVIGRYDKWFWSGRDDDGVFVLDPCKKEVDML